MYLFGIICFNWMGHKDFFMKFFMTAVLIRLNWFRTKLSRLCCLSVNAFFFLRAVNEFHSLQI